MNKQIEELKEIINMPCTEIIERAIKEFECPLPDEYTARNICYPECSLPYMCDECIARNIYNAGYRRQDEVAIEIISEIEQAIMAHGTNYTLKRLEEIKKKYGVEKDGKAD